MRELMRTSGVSILVCCALVSPIGAQTGRARPIAQLVHTTWTAKDGAPTQIRALAQTTDGYLWIGTLTGVVRFDGVRFVPLTLADSQTVPTAGVRRLLATRDGTLWIVWRNGSVSQLRGDRLTTYGAADGLPAVRDLAESRTGELVGGSAAGLVRFAGGKWEDVTRSWGFPGTQSLSVWFDSEDALWAHTQDRMVYRPAGGQQFLDPGIPQAGVATTQFAQARDGAIWVAEMTRSAHTIRRVGASDPITEVLVGVWTVQIDRKGSLWVGTVGDGLRRVPDPVSIRGQRVAQFGAEAEQFTVKDGLLSDFILAMLADREGNVWVASDKGVERFREGAFAPMPTIWPGRPHMLYALRDSSVWATAFNGRGFLRMKPPFELQTRTSDSSMFYNLHQDAAGQIWRVSGPRIERLKGEYFATLPVRPGKAAQLLDLVVDKDGTAWTFDHQLGLFRIEADSLALVAPFPPSTQLHTYLLADRQGKIWVAQENRVIQFDHGQLRVFPAGRDGDLQSVTGILEDRGGKIWVFGEAGLSRFEGDGFRTLRGRQTLPGRWVHGAAIDDDGAWWVATPVGVLRLEPGEVDRAIADSTHTLRYRAFDGRDGLPGQIAQTFRGPLVVRSVDGRIWSATDNGVATVDPRELAPEQPPAVLIELLRVNGQQLSASGDMVLPPAVRDLEIDFTSTNLSTPERVQFRYQLDGEDPEWHDVGTRRRAYYTGLGPGTYRFHVTARLGEGDWNEAGAVLSFRVLPVWYQTLWFRGAAVLLIAALGAATAGLVQRRQHLRAQLELSRQFDERLAERTRIARELHDTLLQTVQGSKIVTDDALDRPDDHERLRQAMTRVSEWLGQAVVEGRAALNSLRGSTTEIDLAEALRRAADNPARPATLTVSVTTTGASRTLHPVVQEEVYRIGQEGIRNACMHSRATRLDIELDYGSDLVIRMTDDGVGVDVAAGTGSSKPGHYGMAGMHERADDIGGTLSVEPANPGTRVTLVVPGGSAFLSDARDAHAPRRAHDRDQSASD